MHSLGLALVVAACVAWVLGANAILRPRQLRPDERPLVFALRPLPRLGDLTQLQKRKLLGLLVGVVGFTLLGLALALGAFER